MGGRLADYITKTFEFQHDKICEYSKGRLAAKVNVALPNTASILAVLNRSNFRAWIKENPDINVCVYTTKTGLCGIGPQVHLMGIPILPSFLKIDPKSDFYSVNDKLFGVFSDKMCTPECHNSKLLIFSCLKLKEGISIPSLTGYIHLNQNLTSEFLVQAITRAARLLGVDRKTRDQKVGNLDEISNYNELFAEYIKQYCLVNVPDGRLFEEVYRMFKEHIWNNELFGRFSGSTQRPVGPWPPDPRPFPTSPEVPTTEKEYYHKLIVDMCEGLSELEILLLETLGLIDTGYQKVFESIKKECVLDPWPETQIDWIKIEKIMKDQPILDYVMKNKRKYAPKGAFPAEAIKRYGTIYTPEFVVEKTVDLAWKYLPKDVDPLSLTWCDPAAGDGNFLVYVYDRLMKCPSSMNPVEKSTHILTKCLFGIEILKPMVVACKVRLLERHIKTVKESGIPGELNVWDKLNITHGNTIMVPEDVGKWELSEYEGGLLPEEIRNKRYSVVCGNPPYTHLRNLANRRYSAYPKQRDMAQVFVRWALDHITEKGVVSYNTTDAWLNVKLSDGAKETRQLINKRIREIIREQDVVNYSMGDGGDIRTFIICLGTTENELFVLNGRETQKDIMEPAFCDLQVKSILNFHYALFNRTFPRCEGNKVRTNSDKMRNIYFNDNGQTWFLFCKYQPKNILPGLWKLVNTDEFISFSKRNLESRIRRCEMNKESALFLVGYLNTTSGIIETSRISVSANMDVRQLSTDGLKSIRIPDFDYYKSTYPERFAAYMKWVEDNMRNKDAFLSGIDAAFKKLIGEEND
jgi:hypothetical protein